MQKSAEIPKQKHSLLQMTIYTNIAYFFFLINFFLCYVGLMLQTWFPDFSESEITGSRRGW